MHNRQQPTVQYLPPQAITPYIGQWIQSSISGIGSIIAYIGNYSPRSGLVDMWVYLPGSNQPQAMQYHARDLVGIGPYYGPIPPQQSYPSQPVPPSFNPYPPYYPPTQPVRKSCNNYKNRSQQLACHMGLIPPI